MKELVIPDELKEIQGCVYRVWYGNYYIVVMGKTFARSLTSIINDLNRFKKGVREGKSEHNIYLNFYLHILSNPDRDFQVQMLFKSDSPFKLLKWCQIALAEGEAQESCLNSKYTPYINQNIQHNKVAKEKRGQVSRGTVLNFLKWRKQTYPNRFSGL